LLFIIRLDYTKMFFFNDFPDMALTPCAILVI